MNRCARRNGQVASSLAFKSHVIYKPNSRDELPQITNVLE